MPQVGELEGVALSQIAIIVIPAGHQTLALRGDQVNTHQLLLLPGECQPVAVAVVDFRQQTIGADEINAVAIAVIHGGQQINAATCCRKYPCLLRAAVKDGEFPVHIA